MDGRTVAVRVVPVIDEAALEQIGEQVCDRIRRAVIEGAEAAEKEARTLVRVTWEPEDIARLAGDTVAAAIQRNPPVPD